MSRYYPVAAVLIACLACTEKKDKEPLPNWQDGYEGSGSADTDGEDTDTTIQIGRTETVPEHAFALGIPDSVAHPYRLRRLNTEETPCAAGGEFPIDVTCVLEINELDLYLLGFVHDIVVPDEFCDFVLLRPYLFKNWEVGQGPTEVSWEIVNTGDEEAPDGGDGEMIINENNSRGGVPYCEFDHSDVFGPNCCVGNYVRTVVNHKTGEVETVKGSWGGNLSECFDGGAFLRTDVEFDEAGWPKSEYFYLNRDPALLEISYDNIGENRGSGSNVFLSNHYAPEEHADNLPLAVAEPPTRPTYDVECVDDAWEMIAAIHLVVREWNEEVELNADGDPDSTGEEVDWDHPLDDLSDFKTLTPGDDTLPELPVVR